jgi:hypothetical protein
MYLPIITVVIVLMLLLTGGATTTMVTVVVICRALRCKKGVNYGPCIIVVVVVRRRIECVFLEMTTLKKNENNEVGEKRGLRSCLRDSIQQLTMIHSFVKTQEVFYQPRCAKRVRSSNA